jgi:hypothetical protein
MIPIHELLKLPIVRGVTLFIFVFSSTLPCFWFIYQFAPMVYKTEPLINLLLISIACSIPIIILNTLILTPIFISNDFVEGLYGGILFGSLCFTTALYFPVILSYTNGKFSFTKAIPYSFGINIFLILEFFTLKYLDDRKNKRLKLKIKSNLSGQTNSGNNHPSQITE